MVTHWFVPCRSLVDDGYGFVLFSESHLLRILRSYRRVSDGLVYTCGFRFILSGGSALVLDASRSVLHPGQIEYLVGLVCMTGLEEAVPVSSVAVVRELASFPGVSSCWLVADCTEFSLDQLLLLDSGGQVRYQLIGTAVDPLFRRYGLWLSGTS